MPEQLGFAASEPGAGLDGELRLALARPATFLPAELSLAEQEAVLVADLLYDGLTESDARRAELRPGLATSWEANAEVTEWTFVLDTERTAQGVVVDHFQSLRSTAMGATAVVLDQIVLVESVGEDRVRFTLVAPNAGFPWLLSGVGLSVVGEGTAPTGRYDVLFDDDEKLQLRDRSGQGLDVSIVWEETARDAYNQLTLGAVDVAVAPPDALDDARSRYGVSPPARAISRFYVLNPRSDGLAEPGLRRALLAAVDRSALVADVIEVPAFALDGVLAPTLAGFTRSGCGQPCAHDPDGATRLVDETVAADLEGAAEIRIATTADQAAVASAIADDLAAVGLEPTVEIFDLDELTAAVEAGDVELAAAGWPAPATSVDAVVPLLLGPSSPFGADDLVSPAVQRTLDAAATTIDDEARWLLLADAHTEAMTSGVALPVAVAKSYLVAAPHAQGIPQRADGTIDLFGFELRTEPSLGVATINGPRRSGGIGRRASLRG